jgi:hypothetical protein
MKRIAEAKVNYTSDLASRLMDLQSFTFRADKEPSHLGCGICFQ